MASLLDVQTTAAPTFGIGNVDRHRQARMREKRNPIRRLQTFAALAGVVGSLVLAPAFPPAAQAIQPATYPSPSSPAPASGDYDGDGKADFAIWRPSSAVWYLKFSSHIPDRQQQWGAAGDIPVLGDFDGDGKADFAIWRPSTAVWYLKFSSHIADRQQQWGRNGDVPVSGDFDGDGKADFAIWRPSSAVWYLKFSSHIRGSAAAVGPQRRRSRFG